MSEAKSYFFSGIGGSGMMPLAMIVRRQGAKNSPMPNGLVDGYSREEILDLVAYLSAGPDSVRSVPSP